MAILVTGADGFIGSHLVEELVKQGRKVKAFVYYNSFNTYGWLDSFPKEMLKEIEIFSGDIRDSNGVRTFKKKTWGIEQQILANAKEDNSMRNNDIYRYGKIIYIHL